MSDTDYYTLKNKAEAMGLNWPRMYGVAIERHEDCWDSITEVLEDCLEQAEEAIREETDPHAVVRTQLIKCMTGQVEELLDDGCYDCDPCDDWDE
jgi:hypothetical protein